MSAEELEKFHAEKNRYVPRYELLYRALRDRITRLPPEVEFLPYQEELAREFGVSRITVRGALRKLSNAGYIEMRRGAGCRVLKRTVEAHRPVLFRTGFSGAVGFLFSSQDPDPAKRIKPSWQLVEAMERVFSRHGLRTVIYNLREDDWRFWTPEKVCESLAANGIRRAVMIPGTGDYPFDALFRQLTLNRVEIDLSLQDANLQYKMSRFLRPGVSFVTVNTVPALDDALERYWRNPAPKLVLYLSNESQNDFIGPRLDICRRFAGRYGIPFEHIRSPFIDMYSTEFILNDTLVNADTAEAVRGRLSAVRGRVLCVCANDEVAYSLLRKIPRPKNTDFLGHDNLPIAAECGISTIDFNYEARAEAHFALYIESPEDSRGIVVGGRFIDRRNFQDSTQPKGERK